MDMSITNNLLSWFFRKKTQKKFFFQKWRRDKQGWRVTSTTGWGSSSMTGVSWSEGSWRSTSTWTSSWAIAMFVLLEPPHFHRSFFSFFFYRYPQQEFRLVKAHGKTEEHEEKRILGLTLLRGECVISLSVEAPPTQDVCTFHLPFSNVTVCLFISIYYLFTSYLLVFIGYLFIYLTARCE